MSAKRLSNLFPRPDADAAALLDGFGRLLDKVHPLRGRHRDSLRYGIRDLSRMLTDERGEMSKDYMGQPATRAAYLRYFLPWNLYRLVRLFQGLKSAGHLALPPEDGTLADLGAGPLTVPLALWIALTESRERRMRVVCVDRTPGIMRDGLKLLEALSGGTPAWKIDLLKGPLHTPVHGGADLLVAANALNELHWGPGGNMPGQAERVATTLRKNLADKGRLLVIEPGTRRSGSILANLREQAMPQGLVPVAPCPHDNECPMPGSGTRPWCHFRLEAGDAPPWLQGLSRRAGLQKEDASISFLLLEGAPEREAGRVRAVSNIFPVPGGTGQYGCSERGLVLIQAPNQSRSGWPGDLLEPDWPETPEQDEKSGALVLRVDGPRPQQAEAPEQAPAPKPARAPKAGAGKPSKQRRPATEEGPDRRKRPAGKRGHKKQ